MHFQLGEGVMISAEADLIISSTVEVAKAHAVCPLLRTLSHVGNVDSGTQPLGGRPVE